jgi:hypothetical protein
MFDAVMKTSLFETPAYIQFAIENRQCFDRAVNAKSHIVPTLAIPSREISNVLIPRFREYSANVEIISHHYLARNCAIHWPQTCFSMRDARVFAHTSRMPVSSRICDAFGGLRDHFARPGPAGRAGG